MVDVTPIMLRMPQVMFLVWILLYVELHRITLIYIYIYVCVLYLHILSYRASAT